MGDAAELGPLACGGDGSLTGASASMDQLRVRCMRAHVHTHSIYTTSCTRHVHCEIYIIPFLPVLHMKTSVVVEKKSPPCRLWEKKKKSTNLDFTEKHPQGAYYRIMIHLISL